METGALRYPISWKRAAVTSAGPFAVALFGVLILVMATVTLDEADAWHRMLVTNSIGRTAYLLCLAVVVVLGGMPFIAAARRLPALQLDRMGVVAWSELRLRTVPWSEVVGISGVEAVGSGRTPIRRTALHIYRRFGSDVRVHQTLFEVPLEDVAAEIKQWLALHRPNLDGWDLPA